MDPPKTPRPLTAAAWMILVTGFFWLLIIGRPLLIPLVLAFLSFYLIEAITRQILKLRLGGLRVPDVLARPVAILVILGLMAGGGTIIANNAGRVAEAAPQYQKRALEIYEDVRSTVHGWTAGKEEAIPSRSEGGDPPAGSPDPGSGESEPGESPENSTDLFSWIAERVDLGAAIGSLASGIGGLLGNFAMILVYLFFLLMERRYLRDKLIAIVPDRQRRAGVQEIIQKIDRDFQTYLGVKSFVSALTATGSYIIMRLVGLDFAEFFALLIFLCNFIPNLGSLVATLLPTLVALFQFDSIGPFLVIGIGVTVIQLFVANVVEPPLMGKSLNLSPLVVILALVFWGMIWGVPGMFLCVPLTVAGMIVLARNESTRWVAVLLSKDGKPKVGDGDGGSREAKR